MKPRFFSLAPCLLLATASLFVPACLAEEATLLNQWNWNTTVSASYNLPSAGTVLSGTAAGYGQSAPSTPLSTILFNGVPSDPGTVISGTNWNRAATINPPMLTAANASAGVQFLAPTTGMNPGEAVKLTWSQTVGFRSSRYWQLLVSTNGINGTYTAPTGGTGSSISQFINGYNSGTAPISGTATVNVSSGGVIDFRTINGNWISQAVTTTSTNPLPIPLVAGWVDDISYTLPTEQGYENNPNFAFAIVGLWDPNITTATSGTTGLVSSFSGLDSTNLISGYNRSVASGGSMRLDLVSVYAIVPEPSIYTLLGFAALLTLLVIHKRRKAARGR
jgi:hypothetical protein